MSPWYCWCCHFVTLS